LGCFQCCSCQMKLTTIMHTLSRNAAGRG
jgi:hypothetical protein